MITLPKDAALARLEDAHRAMLDAATSLEHDRENRVYAMGEAYRAGATLEEIGATIGVSHSAVHHAMSRLGIAPATLRGPRDALSSETSESFAGHDSGVES